MASIVMSRRILKSAIDWDFLVIDRVHAEMSIPHSPAACIYIRTATDDWSGILIFPPQRNPWELSQAEKTFTQGICTICKDISPPKWYNALAKI